jgi:hypothetical protein
MSMISRGIYLLKFFSKMVTVALSEGEIQSMLGVNMIDITATAIAAADIWPYVEELTSLGVLPPFVTERHIVAFVFRDEDNTFDHVLLPTDAFEIFVVLVIELGTGEIRGHYEWDLKKYYGLDY